MRRACLFVLLVMAVTCAAGEGHPQKPDRLWGAIAIFCPPGGDGCRTIVGSNGYGRTETLAKNAAIADCLGADIDLSQQRYCKVVHAFNKGCFYLVAGCNKLRSVCGYALGRTETEARSRCASQGYDCSDPQSVEGGCVAK